MKYNLKDRPKPILGGQRGYEEWFEGFEAELRARLDDRGKTISGYSGKKKYGMNRMIKEVLGE